ncbi:DMT family transporter [Acaryochloris sp. IP29b_bin.137]|uniref:DMT family transporter n=1 Tax=Acaryochloris sp. IP29b_bin.137 TaxID=2969217 RepID=UPI00261CC6B2|nr:DMT family transporter [Acaryochloris sp. IP29b_bin.137]
MSIQNFLKLLLLAAIWGSSFLFTRIAVPEWGPIWLIELRVLLAGITLLPLIFKLDLWLQIRQHWRALILLGILNSALPFCLLAYASLSLSAGFTAILNATTPLFGLWIVAFWLQEALSVPRLVGFAIGFLGVVLLVGLQDVPLTLDKGIAIAAGLLAALLYAIAAPYIQQRFAGVSALAVTTGSQLSAAVCLMPLLPFSIPSQLPSTQALLSMMALAILSSVLAQMLYYHLIKVMGPSKTLTVAYLVPLFAMLWGALALREIVTISMGVGCGLVLLGTAIANDLFTPKNY